MKKAGRRATFQDLEAVPDTMVGEFIDGELYVSPRPAGLHTFAASNLGYDLIGPYQRGKGGPGGWWIVDEPELHLGEDALIPDLAGWRQERMTVYPKDPADQVLAEPFDEVELQLRQLWLPEGHSPRP
jgi:hypothetical protein